MLTRTLAAFAANQAIPDAILHVAKRSLLNACAAAIGAADSEPVQILLQWSEHTFATGPSQVWFRPRRLSAPGAAAINGTMIHELDYDDTHAATLVHPTAPVLPAALSLGEVSHASGRDVLTAFAIGGEIALRLGAAVFPTHYDRGYHVTATGGVIGAAAAGARVLRLGVDAAEQALGIAATRSSGLRQTFGSHCKSGQVGQAASDGAAAGQLAAAGLHSGRQMLDGPSGWAPAVAGGFDPVAFERLGETWLLHDNSFKAFACGNVMQAVVDGAVRIRAAEPFAMESIESVALRVSPRAVTLCGNPTPTTGLEGKFSLYHAAAVALIDGRGGEAQFVDSRVTDPAVQHLRAKVVVEVDRRLDDLQAEVRIGLSDGRTLGLLVEDCLGSLGRPLTDAMLEDKFAAMADGRLGLPTQRALIDSIWNLEQVPDIQDWAHRLNCN
jgi:2-methylcitrate dehydratase PrpD